MKRVWPLVLLVSCAAPPSVPAPPPAKEKRPLVVEDMFRVREVADLSISPGGDRVAYTLKWMDRDANKHVTELWIVTTQDAAAKPLVRDASSPGWSPDGGKIAFLLAGGGKAQIWTVGPDGLDLRRITDVPRGASNPVWSPDGTRIAFLTRAMPDEKEPPLAVEPAKDPDPRVVTEPTYRREGQYFDGTEAQLCVVEVASGRTRQLTSGRYGVGDPAWSPDSKRIAFTSNREEPKYFARNSDIWIISAEGGEPGRFTTNPGPDSRPAWSPHGKWIAYLGHEPHEWGVWQTDLWIQEVDGGAPVNLTKDHDRTIEGGPAWSADWSSIYITSPDRGYVRLFEVNVATKRAEPFPLDRAMVVDFDVAKNGVAMVATTPHEPQSVWFTAGRSAPPRPLTRHNEWLAEIILAPQEEVAYAGDEFTIQGWYQPPAGRPGRAKAPMISYVHGGPAWHYGWRWFFEMQLISARGYALFFCNPRGSTGYGEKFHKANEKDWGGGDYRDIMAGVEHVVQSRAEVDAARLGVTGGSYGGYMTNWIVGHTDRFKAAVTQRCVSNLVSFLNSDIHLWLAETYFNTTPWDGFEILWKHSPIAHVKNMKTPILILHSEGDYRTPINQAEELFVALRKLNQAPVEFVRFPLPEGHELSRSGTPSRQRERLNRILGWFDKFLKAGE